MWPIQYRIFLYEDINEQIKEFPPFVSKFMISNLERNFKTPCSDSRQILTLLNYPTVLDLTICGESLTKEVFKDFAEGLKQNRTLRTLSLSAIGIDDETFKIMVEALETNTTLQTLSFNFMVIDDARAKILAEAIRKNKTLQNLRIQQCGALENGRFIPAGQLGLILAQLREERPDLKITF